MDWHIINSPCEPVLAPARSIPYHVKERVIEEIVKQDVIEEHPSVEPAPWISNVMIAPKSDRLIRMTAHARNVNKVVQASNLPTSKLSLVVPQYFRK